MTKYISISQTLLGWCGSLFLIDYGSLQYVIHETLLIYSTSSTEGSGKQPNMRQLRQDVTLNKDHFFPGCMCTHLPHCLHTHCFCL